MLDHITCILLATLAYKKMYQHVYTPYGVCRVEMSKSMAHLTRTMLQVWMDSRDSLRAPGGGQTESKKIGTD